MVKLSILVPAYNAEKYILDNLNSIKRQTYSNWEVIVVNDGSTDNTEALVNSFINSNPTLQISLISIPNGGLANARNVAFSNCTGDYFCNLDADDFLEPKTLQFVAEAYEKEACDVYYFDIIDYNEQTGCKTNFSDRFEKPEQTLKGIDAAILKLKRKIWICQGVAFYNSELIRKSELKNIPGINQGEDMYFITSALALADKVKYICYAGTDIRYRSDSMMHSCFNESFLQCLQAIDNLLTHCKDLNIPDDKYGDFISLIKRERILQELRIAKSICDGWGIKFSYSDTLRKLKGYSWIISDANPRILSLLSKSHRAQYYLNRYIPSAFILLTRLHRRLS